MVCFLSCKDKRHDKSKEHQLDHYAFVLMMMLDERDIYLDIMRRNICEKTKIISTPNDTLEGSKKRIDDYDTMFFEASNMIYFHKGKDSANLYDDTPPTAFTEKENNYLKTRITNAVNTYSQISDTYKTFNNYFLTKEYIKDKDFLGRLLLDSIHSLDLKFTTISDSIILKSDTIFKDIQQIPKNIKPSVQHATAMNNILQMLRSFTSHLDSVKVKKDIINIVLLKKLKDSIEDKLFQYFRFGVPEGNASFWEGVINSRFKNLLSDIQARTDDIVYRLSRNNKLSNNDLDCLKDREQLMQHYYNLFIKL